MFIVHDDNNNYMRLALITSSEDRLDEYSSKYTGKYIDVILTYHR